jgi:cation-transporting ATPase G
VVFIHELAEVFVIGNGVRAGRLRPRGTTEPAYSPSPLASTGQDRCSARSQS